MGKVDETQLAIEQQEEEGGVRCWMGLSRIFQQFTFKCFFILLLTFSLFFSTLFFILPTPNSNPLDFDATPDIQNTATVQAYFELQKPVSELIPQIARLEYDINAEIGVEHTKVAILSMHQTSTSNWTDVMFGFLPDPINAPVDPASLAVLHISLIGLFLQTVNLTLTNSSFGQPSSFEILEFPGGISIIKQSPLLWDEPISFNFTLNNSMSEVYKNIVQLREQLKLGLHLMPDENVYVKQLDNKNGSTRDPPVIVEAYITLVLGRFSPQRLKQLAQNITRSPGKNLGLNNTVFGKVKEVSLSSNLNHTIDASPPPSSPAPSPTQNDHLGPSPSPYPSLSPSNSSSPSTSFAYPPDGRLPPTPGSEPPLLGSPTPMAGHCGKKLIPSISPAPHALDLPPPASNPPSVNGRTSRISPTPSPLLAPSYGSSRRKESPSETLPFSSMAPSELFFHKKSWWFCYIGVLAFHLPWLDLLIWSEPKPNRGRPHMIDTMSRIEIILDVCFRKGINSPAQLMFTKLRVKYRYSRRTNCRILWIFLNICNIKLVKKILAEELQ